MKITVITLVLLFLSVQFVSAQQPSKADLEKMMQQAQDQMKKYSGDTTLNKVMKNMQDQQKQVSNGMKNQSANNNAANTLDPSDYSNVDNWKFPAKNTALLSSLPKKVLTKPELVSFLNDIYTELSKKLSSGISSSVQSITAKYNNDGNKMGDAAVAGWYTNYREESLLLIVKAAANNPDNGLLLNNCAAILNMSGIEQKAIPILKYVLQSYPGSGMVLNNIGQAYAGLGETDTAMVYFGRCLKAEPENPEANNTAGQIEATKGNTQKAIEYFEQSIKSAYNKPAALKLRKIKKDTKLVPLVRPRVKIPEYFNLFKYQLPEQCTSTENAEVADAEHTAFREMISKEIDKYGKKVGELSQRKLSTANKVIQSKGAGRLLNKGEFMSQPYYELCGIMSRDFLHDYLEEVDELGRTVTPKFVKEKQALEDEYQQKYKIMMDDFGKRCPDGEGSNGSNCPSEQEVCNAQNTLANSYLPKFAAITKDWQEKNKLVYQKYFDDMAYWTYLVDHPVGDDEFRLFFCERVLEYLTRMAGICVTNVIMPCHSTPTTAKKDANEIKEEECPLDIEIPFIVGKFELSCDKFSFKAGEGAVFGYEKNFKTHQSTVSVGIGLKGESEFKLGPLKGGVSRGVSETIFITFDGNNGFSDAGLKFDAKISGGVEGEVGEGVKGKKDILKQETGIGYTVGICSGWNFKEGPFKGMIGPAPEVPLNKNVKIYNP